MQATNSAPRLLMKRQADGPSGMGLRPRPWATVGTGEVQHVLGLPGPGVRAGARRLEAPESRPRRLGAGELGNAKRMRNESCRTMDGDVGGPSAFEWKPRPRMNGGRNEWSDSGDLDPVTWPR
jgi:hypothetical protein